jgi:hypothetical protein
MASDRTPEDIGSIIGIFVGMFVAGVIAIAFASEAGTFVRYLIMSAGLIVGWLFGRQIGRSRMRWLIGTRWRCPIAGNALLCAD